MGTSQTPAIGSNPAWRSTQDLLKLCQHVPRATPNATPSEEFSVSNLNANADVTAADNGSTYPREKASHSPITTIQIRSNLHRFLSNEDRIEALFAAPLYTSNEVQDLLHHGWVLVEDEEEKNDAADMLKLIRCVRAKTSRSMLTRIENGFYER